MPFSSAEIAQATGAFQQQSMNNTMYSNMIGSSGLMRSQAVDNGAGYGANRAMAYAGPLMSGALGMAGLDPFSLGLKAATGAWSGGAGIMGAGAAGLGVMGAAGVVGLGASYAGNQIMTGAQQQQQLNQALRSNFSHMTPYGQGFDRSQMASIGSTMRGMTHQFGEGGEVTGFSELTQLAANMGKMGMGQGIRDAQDFSRKFKEMVTTLKVVAKDLGSSLEEAQQFMNAQKSSGIFKTGDQLRFTSMARTTAAGGGLALSEVTGMANIGSQISRSVGGLGRAGAFGGMKAIGQIGSAEQIGAISENDIYNATGLTGAEGRQALATNMMSNSAKFLSGGRGRRFLASIAGSNGQLDEESVANWMAGGMSTGDTMAQAQKNLSGVGRANFIRNEGRLRGAALERFGALAPTMAYSQWLGQRGYDPTSMDDKSMLAFQRFSGMGRDEADVAVKMVSQLPELIKQQRMAGQDDAYQQRVGEYQKTQGIEGMKRRLEQVREGIQGKLQQVGSNLFTSGTDMIEQWWNRSIGVYEKRMSADIDQLMQSARMGGKGAADLNVALGGGGKFVGGNMFKNDIATMASKLGGASGSPAGVAAFEASQEMQFAAKMGAGGSTKVTSDFVASNKEWIRSAYADGLAGVNSQQRLNEFGNQLKLRANGGDPKAQEMLKSWSSASKSGQAAMLGSIEKEAGISKDASLAETWKHAEQAFHTSGFATKAEGDLAVGKAFLGERAARLGTVDNSSSGSLLGTLARGAGTALDVLTGRALNDQFFRNTLGNATSGGDLLTRSAGEYMRSAEGGRIIRGIMTGDKAAMSSAQDVVTNLRAKAGTKEDGSINYENLSQVEQAQFGMITQTELGAEYGKLMNQGAGPQQVAPLLEKAKKKLGRAVSEEELKQFYAVGGAAVGAQARENVAHATERTLDFLRERSQTMRASGIAVVDPATGQLTQKDAMKLGAGRFAVDLAIQATNLTKSLTEAKTPEERAAILSEVYGKEGQAYEQIAGLSIADKRKLAKGAAGSDVGSMAGESIMREQRLSGLIRSRGGRGTGQAGAVAQMLGLGGAFGKEEMQGLGGKSAEELAGIFAGKLGAGEDTGFKDSLKSSIEAIKSGKTGLGADLLSRAVTQADPKTREKIKQSQQDPMETLVDATKQSNKFLEALVKSNDKANGILMGIENGVSKNGNPEAAPGSGGRPSGDGRPGA